VHNDFRIGSREQMILFLDLWMKRHKEKEILNNVK